MRRAAITLSLLATTLLGATAEAKLYKWVNEDGETVFSDQPPPEPTIGHDVLNKRGLTVGSIGKAPTAEELAENARLDKAQREAAERRAEIARIDSLLRQSFPTIEAVRSARADRMATVDDSIDYLNKRRESVLAKHLRNAQRIENFNRKQLDVPAQLTMERSQLARSLENLDQQIATMETDREAIRTEFDAYEQRLVELTELEAEE